LITELVGILDTSDVPIIVVGRDCNVARFNRAAAETLGATQADVGRRACEMRALAGVPEAEQMGMQVMVDGVPLRKEMREGDRWFLVRIAPYAGTNAQVRGAVFTFTNITAFRASLGQAIYEREYTKTILNAVMDPLVVLDERLQIQTANRAFYDWFGVSREQTQGVPLRELGHDDWKTHGVWSALDATLCDKREFQTLELESHFPSIGRRTVLLDARRLAREGNALVLLSFRDITTRKLAEHALRESEARFRTLFESMDEGYSVIEMIFDEKNTPSDYRFLEVNPAFEKQTGIKDAKGRLMRQIAPDHEQHWFDIFGRIALTGEALRFENPAAALQRHYEVCAFRIGAPELRRVGIVFNDITHRKQAEEIRSRLAAVVESSDDAILSKNLDGIIITWNSGASRMFGYTAQEVIGRPVTVLTPADQVDEEPGILIRLRRGEHIDNYETVRRRKDGTRINVSLSVSPIKDVNGSVIGASTIVRDITQQKTAERSLRELYVAAQREIARREKAEATLREIDRRKDEFLATLAHELRNPLAPIRQASAIAKAATATEEQKRWGHDVIDRQVNHMSLLLEDLLDISRVTRGTLELRPQITDLTSIIEMATETARPLIEAKRHALKIEIPDEPAHFAADPLRLAQVLSNLLTNAAKYTDPEGEIRLRATCSAETVSFSVADNGIGISADALQEVFTMFSQVKSTQDRSEGGLGIGLALAKGLIHLHRGTLEVRSEGTGCGSEFMVNLPRTTLSTAMGQPTSVPSAPQVSRRVLIADDNKDAADSLAMLLRMDGHDITVVHDGRQAMATIESFRAEIALLDIGMPGLNGYEVARHIRQGPLGSVITLIAVTGWGQASDKARAIAAGFNHHFTKPVEPDALIRMLRAISGGAPKG
jgi:PAS domain S-box-containing protein